MLYNQRIDSVRERAIKKKNGDGRSAFRRDLARLIHSPCFRRLQGKTQLLPSDENDFFRNRLTHSIEAGQIATGIAINLNSTHAELRGRNAIDLDLLQFAAFAHDLGHPPFGHNGERVLDSLMAGFGGFEGNAQTLRILVRLEKKEIEGAPATSDEYDSRVGLNLTHRSIASVLKYDHVIPRKRASSSKLPKGYYWSEKGLIEKIKKSLAPECPQGDFKTIECSIMDLADDIAYSTYDLEDAFKAGFSSPLAMAGADTQQKENIVGVVNRKMKEEFDIETFKREKLTIAELDSILGGLFSELFVPSETVSRRWSDGAMSDEDLTYALTAEAYASSNILRDNSFLRSEFTSRLVNIAMSGVELQWNQANPRLSRVRLAPVNFKIVEILKRFAYESLISSNRLKMVDRRGREIIEKIFKALSEENGDQLLPDDLRSVFLLSSKVAWRKRVICDFIASMTDRYCVEFYSRLTGISVPSIYKPF